MLYQKNLLAAACAAMLAMPAVVSAYSEDTRAGAVGSDVDSHSTFHFEMVRTLARAAGFTPEQASRIAEASHAVDTFPTPVNTQLCSDVTDPASTEVNNGSTLHILGTVRSQSSDPRIAQQAPYFHWPRRPQASLNAELYIADGIQDETCANFGRRCQYEVQELEAWVYSADADAFSTAPVQPPCYAEPGQSYQTVPAGGLIALGVYLHSLADSYSHQLCIEVAGVRTHDSDPGTAQPAECEAQSWHLEEEYGDSGDLDANGQPQPGFGVIYTVNAAVAVWNALNWYPLYAVAPETLPQPAASAEALNLQRFIDDFAQQDRSATRSCIAADYYDLLVTDPAAAYDPAIAADCRLRNN